MTNMLLSLLVIASTANDVLPIVCTDFTYDSEHGIAEGVPPAFDTARVSRGERISIPVAPKRCNADAFWVTLMLFGSVARPPFWTENSNSTMLQIYRNRQINNEREVKVEYKTQCWAIHRKNYKCYRKNLTSN